MCFGMVQKQRNRLNYAPLNPNVHLKESVLKKNRTIQVSISREGASYGFKFDEKLLMPLNSTGIRKMEGVMLPEIEEEYEWKAIDGI